MHGRSRVAINISFLCSLMSSLMRCFSTVYFVPGTKYQATPNEPCFTEAMKLINAKYYSGVILRGTIVNRTYGIHKNLYVQAFLPTIFGPVNYGPP